MREGLNIYVCEQGNEANERQTDRQTNRHTWPLIDVQKRTKKNWNNHLPGVKDTNIDLHASLADEAAKFGDILQTDFIDTYVNVTLKALSGLDFATRNSASSSSSSSSCGEAFHYVAKVDDDVFLNIDNAVKYLHEYKLR